MYPGRSSEPTANMRRCRFCVCEHFFPYHKMNRISLFEINTISKRNVVHYQRIFINLQNILLVKRIKCEILFRVRHTRMRKNVRAIACMSQECVSLHHRQSAHGDRQYVYVCEWCAYSWRLNSNQNQIFHAEK